MLLNICCNCKCGAMSELTNFILSNIRYELLWWHQVWLLTPEQHPSLYPLPFAFPSLSREIISQDSQNGSICSDFQLKAKLEKGKWTLLPSLIIREKRFKLQLFNTGQWHWKLEMPITEFLHKVSDTQSPAGTWCSCHTLIHSKLRLILLFILKQCSRGEGHVQLKRLILCKLIARLASFS